MALRQQLTLLGITLFLVFLRIHYRKVERAKDRDRATRSQRVLASIFSKPEGKP